MQTLASYRTSTIFCLAAIAAGSAAGWALRPVKTPVAPPPANQLPPQRQPSRAASFSASTRNWVELIRQAGTASAQCLASLAFLDIRTTAEIRELLDAVSLLPPHGAESVAIDALLRRWLELDPSSAMEYCRMQHPNRMPDLLANYAAEHPSDVERIALTMPAGFWTGYQWRKLCRAVAAIDQETAWTLFEHTPRDAEYEASKVVGDLAALDFDRTAARVEALRRELRGYARGALALEKMKVDPVGGWDWIRSQPDPFYMIQHTVDRSFQSEPAKALALLAALTSAELATLQKTWRFSFNMRDVPATAAALAASSLGPETKQTLAMNFLYRGQQSDPAEAAAFFAMLSTEEQVKKLPAFVYHWAIKDASAARAWVENLPPGPMADAAEKVPENATLADALEGVAKASGAPESLAGKLRIDGYITPEDPRLATLTAEGFGAVLEAITRSSQLEFTRTLARTNTDAVTGWLENNPSVNSETGQLIARFFNEWAADSPVDAAAWVSRQPDSPASRTAAANTTRQYLRHAPGDARRWVDSLPAGAVRDAAQAVLEAAP